MEQRDFRNRYQSLRVHPGSVIIIIFQSPLHLQDEGLKGRVVLRNNTRAAEGSNGEVIAHWGTNLQSALLARAMQLEEQPPICQSAAMAGCGTAILFPPNRFDPSPPTFSLNILSSHGQGLNRTRRWNGHSYMIDKFLSSPEIEFENKPSNQFYLLERQHPTGVSDHHGGYVTTSTMLHQKLLHWV